MLLGILCSGHARNTTGAVIIRLGFGGPLYSNYNKEPHLALLPLAPERLPSSRSVFAIGTNEERTR